jgi:hypothetical protein
MPNAADALVNFRQSRLPLTLNGSPVFESPGYRIVDSAYFNTGVAFNAFLNTSFGFTVAIKNNASTNPIIGTGTNSTADANTCALNWDGTTLTGRMGDSGANMSAAFSGSAGVVGMSRTGTTTKLWGAGLEMATKTVTNSAFVSNNILWGRRLSTTYGRCTFYGMMHGSFIPDAEQPAVASAWRTLVNRLAGGIIA